VCFKGILGDFIVFGSFGVLCEFCEVWVGMMRSFVVCGWVVACSGFLVVVCGFLWEVCRFRVFVLLCVLVVS